MTHRLSKEQKTFILENYALLGPKLLAVEYNKRFGTEYKTFWAKNIGQRYGLSTKEAIPGWYSIAEVSYLFEVSEQTILDKINTGSIKAQRYGLKKYRIHEDEMPKIKEWYDSVKRKTPWPALSVKEASDRLGISPVALCSVIRRGHIDAVKKGKMYMVKKEHIEWGYNQMLKHGFTKIPWYKMKDHADGK